GINGAPETGLGIEKIQAMVTTVIDELSSPVFHPGDGHGAEVLDNRCSSLVHSYQASMGKEKPRAGELVQGTLDMLVLKTLVRRPMHGYGIAQSIQEVSEEVLRVEEGSLYPALHRLELDGLVDAEWRPSENNRRAKYYRLTARGRKSLVEEANNWKRL